MVPVKGYEGRYSVTRCGKVWSHISSKFLKPRHDNRGYLIVDLKPNKKVHRLVAEAYLPNPHNHPVVHHKDEIKYHNEYTNLEWCTHKHNTKDYYKRRAS